MKELALRLYHQGFSVFNLRLPYHGVNDPDYMNRLKAGFLDNWAEEVYRDIRSRYEKISFCGLSIGAALIINLSKRLNLQNEKLILLAPYLQVKYRRIRFLMPFAFLKKTMPYETADCSTGNHADRFVPFIPLLAAGEMVKTADRARKNIRLIKNPALCILALNDHDAPFRTHHPIILKNPGIRIEVLNKSWHQVTLDCEKERVMTLCLEFLRD
jgi:esterase/lipase